MKMTLHNARSIIYNNETITTMKNCAT